MLILGFFGEYLRLRIPKAVYRIRGQDRAADLMDRLTSVSMDKNLWLGGYLTYPSSSSEVELYVEVHDQTPQPDPGPGGAALGGAWIQVPRAAWDEGRYTRAFEACQQALQLGESYQINLTFPLETELIRPCFAKDVRRQSGRIRSQELLELWRGVGTQSGRFHAGFVYPEGGRGRALLSWSPERWICGRLDGKRWRLESRPMKGTAPRFPDPALDLAEARKLYQGAKTRAENLMITDMVRNEFSELLWKAGGRVFTERLFEVEALNTLWQMTSTVSAEAVYSEHPFSQIIRLLFPPASITGAPKRSTMSWIGRIEDWKRGAYTGVSFLIGPDGRFESSVLIRTLQVNLDNGRSLFGVGGGVVRDSRPADEYREALSKAVFLSGRVADFDLIETLRWEPGRGLVNWHLHARRIRRSAVLLRRPVDFKKALGLIRDALSGQKEAARIRLGLDPSGRWSLIWEPLGALPLPLVLRVAQSPMLGPELLRRLKTSRRDCYESFRPQPGQETLLWDPEGFALEGTFTNLAFFIQGRWRTPSLKRPLLNGVMRQILLQQEKIVEEELKLDLALQAEKIACFNSLRGWMQATWGPRPD